MAYTNYSEVPFYRRGSVNSLFVLSIFVHPIVSVIMGNPTTLVERGVWIASALVSLLLWWTCINLITGEIYSVKKDGSLTTWSAGNKVVAPIFVVLQIWLVLLPLAESVQEWGGKDETRRTDIAREVMDGSGVTSPTETG